MIINKIWTCKDRKILHFVLVYWTLVMYTSYFSFWMYILHNFSCTGFALVNVMGNFFAIIHYIMQNINNFSSNINGIFCVLLQQMKLKRSCQCSPCQTRYSYNCTGNCIHASDPHATSWPLLPPETCYHSLYSRIGIWGK